MTCGVFSRAAVMAAALLALALTPRCGAEPPAKGYRISGVVVSVRDGSPVPYCRITAYAIAAPATPAGENTQASPQGPERGPGLQSGGGRAGGGQAGLRNGNGGNATLEATADGSGKFSIDVPHAGAWRLSAVARGFKAQNYDAHEGFYSAIVLSESAPTLAVTFHLTPDAVLTGLIFDETGEPVGSAQVTAELIPPAVRGEVSEASRPRPVGSAQTDDRGRYEIGGLAPGEYRLRVQAQPWYSAGSRGMIQLRPNPGLQNNPAPPPDPPLDFVYPITWFPGVDDESAAEAVRVAPGEERQADFRLTAMTSFHLKIPRTEIADVAPQGDARNRQPQQRTVSLTRVGGDSLPGIQQQMMPTGVAGNEYDFGGLSPGTYDVRIPGADGRSSEVRQIEVKPGSPAVLTLEETKPLIRVQLELEGISGSDLAMVEFVDTETGQRVSSTPNMRGRGGLQRDEQPNDDSADEPEPTNRVVMLAAHPYEVYVSGGIGAYLTGMSSAGAKITGRVVTFAGAATLTLHLANKHAQLDGLARLSGEPAAGAMVLLVPATFGTAGALTEIERAETNTDGTFRMSSITPGPYILVAIDHGWNVDWRNAATLGQYLMHGVPVNLRPSAKEHLELEAISPN